MLIRLLDMTTGASVNCSGHGGAFYIARQNGHEWFPWVLARVLLFSPERLQRGFYSSLPNRGMKMRDDGHHATEWLWYFSGMLPFAAVSLLWTSMEDQSVTPQRII